jgi:hypothetical protein
METPRRIPMGEPNQQQEPPDQTSATPHPVLLAATLNDLAGAHATAHITSGLAFVSFGDFAVRVALVDHARIVRGLLTDALAQLDAAQAGL